MYTMTMVMVGNFYLMIYYPGTLDTRELFKALTPIWDPLMLICKFVVIPLKTLSDLLLMALPKEAATYFPSAPASILFGAGTPGTLEWLDLLAIPFWGLIVITAQHVNLTPVGDKINKQLEKAAAKPKKEPEMVKVRVKPEEPKKYTPLPEQKMPEREKGGQYKNRLERVKESNDKKPVIDLTFLNNMPQPQVSKESLEEFKKREGDLGMREMLRDLQGENARLQHQQQQMLSEQDQMRQNYAKYFSPNVTRYLEENQMSFQQFNNHACQVSVLFCDIRNFSAYSQTHTPEEVAAFLKEYFDITLNVILNRYDGAINKLMGDGIMAYWGFPIPTIEHAAFATQAAVTILEEVDRRNARSSGLDKLEVGIGIATGEVLIGNIGSADFKDFTLIGTPVNLAARLDNANRAMNSRILISNETHEALKGRIPCQDHGTIEIQGWQSGVRVYEPKS